MNYQEARNYIDNTGSSGIVPGTDVIKELLGRLGNPEAELRVIHVAGTNGKGSVCTYLESALLECGLKVGRYASPSVFRYLERIRLSGEDISEEDYAKAVTAVRNAAADMDTKPTGFEAETAAAFYYFHKKKTDIAIVECGMGGQDDATNVFDHPLATVFTPVSMDHMSFLGDTPEKIAVNKAGIMKKGSFAVISRMPEVFCGSKWYSPEDILKEEAAIRGAFCETCEENLIPEGFENPLPGSFQTDNLNTALHTLRVIDAELKKLFPQTCITGAIIANGLHNAKWPGRFERVSEHPLIIRDGGHNPGAVKALRASMEADGLLPGRHNIHLIMGVFKDKDYKEILRIMLPGSVSFTAIDLPDKRRGLPSEQLAEAAKEICEELKNGNSLSGNDSSDSPVLPSMIKKSYSLEEALRETAGSDQDITLVFGSLSIMQLFEEVDPALFG